MKWYFAIFILLVFSIYFISCSNTSKNKVKEPYPEELSAKIDRGLVCFEKKTNENFLSWRLLPEDPNTPKYFIWRKNNSSNTAELIGTTDRNYFLDQNLQNGKKYLYGVTLTDSVPNKFQEVVPKTNKDSLDFEALTFEIGEDYKQTMVVTGDVDGDGELEILVIYSKAEEVDPSPDAWMKSTDTFKIIVFRRNGTPLWKKDLGWGIEAGLVYAPVIIWDLDADGKCEVILRTNKSKDPLDYSKEFLTILNGENGNIIRETRWPAPPSDDYNSNSRNYIGVAHLDGHNPSIIVGRGTYLNQVLRAYDINLNMLWERHFGTDIKPKAPFNNRFIRKIWSKFSNDQSRASHSLPIADIDGNGTEEILWGEHCITENGDDLWEVKDRIPYDGHPDIVYPADILPQLPGLETFYCREGWRGKENNIGFLLVDMYGNTIWAKWGLTHVDGGWADKVIDTLNGIQLFAFDVKRKDWKPGVLKRIDPTQFLVNSKGKILFEPDSTWIRSFTVDWEGDGTKEIVTTQGNIIRYNGEVLRTFKSGMLWGGDLFGDHREELVYAPFDGKVYIIFNTQKMDTPSKITRLADRRYRNDLSRTAMHINVIPTLSGYIPLKQIAKSKTK